MSWWMPFVPLFDPFTAVSDQRNHVDEKAKSNQGTKRIRTQPKTRRKAARKASKKAASRKSAARKSAPKARTRRR